MSAPGGYTVTPGLYRVPDLKTEEQFVDYMRDIYNVEITFSHAGDKPSAVASRALGESRPMSVLDNETTSVDPVLQHINNSDPGPAYLVSQQANPETEEDETDEAELELEGLEDTSLLPVDEDYNK